MRIDRLMGIVSLLLRQDGVTAPELAELFGVSRRTITRDIDDLCRAGVPLVTVRGHGGGVFLEREAKGARELSGERALFYAGTSAKSGEVFRIRQGKTLDSAAKAWYNDQAVKEWSFTEALVEDRIETLWLFDFYGPLLTQRQRELLALYCEEDLTLSEIAAREGISRQGVYDAVRRGEKTLAEYERQLGLLARYRRLTGGLREGLDALEGAQGEQARRAASILRRLLSEEEG